MRDFSLFILIVLFILFVIFYFLKLCVLLFHIRTHDSSSFHIHVLTSLKPHFIRTTTKTIYLNRVFIYRYEFTGIASRNDFALCNKNEVKRMHIVECETNSPSAELRISLSAAVFSRLHILLLRLFPDSYST